MTRKQYNQRISKRNSTKIYKKKWRTRTRTRNNNRKSNLNKQRNKQTTTKTKRNKIKSYQIKYNDITSEYLLNINNLKQRGDIKVYRHTPTHTHTPEHSPTHANLEI